VIRKGKPPVSVMQEWTWELSFMQQTVLLCAIRGPDGTPKYGSVKMLLRWYRRCVLVSALDGGILTTPQAPLGGSFMGPSFQGEESCVWQLPMDAIVGQYMKELDVLPHHFQLHLMHAIEILGYKHPDKYIKGWWHSVYLRIVHDMHLWPETEEQLDKRLGDCREGWLARADPATVA